MAVSLYLLSSVFRGRTLMILGRLAGLAGANISSAGVAFMDTFCQGGGMAQEDSSPDLDTLHIAYASDDPG
eukprot:CAMPEP_0204158050 /NCGR_PEP_ID=MMETSP0361-20130328/31785_1 /ASSEMBLY_ACC=CAM_ASM_000343 /TAXON_ID=268821 /ORGANISM="Scrippsiella Hangoei, Strain SHTV-5" /LENGTH=70 /DNA_ID=CAMNT_0051113929 /DNA_START=104 /DNA_END=312 /DNA_ORIENTATION=-